MKSDWTITGTGGLAIIEETGSKRCQLSAEKYALWSARNNLTNAEIITEIKFLVGSTNERGGLLLRANASIQSCYRLYIMSPRTYYIQRVVNGVSTTLATAVSSSAYNNYVQTRFRVDGFQLSVEEYLNGAWQLITMAEDTNQSLLEGYAGIFGLSINSSYSILFDNIQISEKA